MATLSGTPPPSNDAPTVAGAFQGTPGPLRVAALQMVLPPLPYLTPGGIQHPDPSAGSGAAGMAGVNSAIQCSPPLSGEPILTLLLQPAADRHAGAGFALCQASFVASHSMWDQVLEVERFSIN